MSSTSSQRSWKCGRSSMAASGGGVAGGSERGSCGDGGSRNGSCTSNEKDSDNDDAAVTVVDMVTMLSCPDQSNAQKILLAMTGSLESCQALRRAGCIPLLIQILHPFNVPSEAQPTQETKLRAAQTLKNVVQFNCDEKSKRKEMRVLKLLESLRYYIDYLKNRGSCINLNIASACEKHPVPSSTALMKLSFDEEHRNAMCLLGAIHTLADLIQTDHTVHGINDNPDCITMRRYNGMTLTNMTVGDKRNKVLLGTMKDFMTSLVAQLDSPSEDVCQVTASVLRNLSWHASSALKASLVDSDAVRKLMITAINAGKESTLKAALSALWNLSAHSHANKNAICQTPNAIPFLVNLLESRTLTIVENAGGILTNISIVTTTDDMTREAFGSCGILEILLNHLQSPSILVVGNACGMLWHLSSCEMNQQRLIHLGAIRKLKVLAGSKHERIKHGACSTLRNILSYSNELTSPSVTPLMLPNKSSPSHQQQPMDLRTSVSQTTVDLPSKPSELHFSNEPLDLSIHSSKSTPIHTVSENEFGPRTTKTVPFLNPLLNNKNTSSYDSPKNYNSCPEFLRFIQPAHKSTPIDFSRAETTPTTEDATINYSLHFTEPEDVPTNKIEDQDTVKTYCCEGTPLNFSTSNSMTDLTQVERPTKLKPIIETETGDDLPRKYCTESTPATFSRASSLSSIASNVQGGENKAEYLDETLPKVTNGNMKEKAKRNVTFSATDTPLMFSRTSSVNSLDSVDINYDDTGSVLSEFSRRASEVVSPSELPDSPRQITPPQPLTSSNSKPKEEEIDTVKVFAKTGESCAASGAQSVRSLSPLTIGDDGENKIGVMEPVKLSTSKSPSLDVPKRIDGTDEIKVFGVEDTPWRGVSTATSLSDLVCEMEKAEVAATVKDKPPTEASSPPPPPLPPKPTLKVQERKSADPVYVDTSMIHQSQKPYHNIEKPTAAPRLPKSKSELSKLNTKSIKMSTSYHENLKRENLLDPELAALIMKGKSRVRGNKTSNSKNPTNGKVYCSADEKKKDKEMKQEGCGVTGVSLVTTSDIKVGAETAIIANKSPNVTKLNSAEQREIQKVKADSKINQIQQSTTSMGSEWNEDTLSLSVPSLSISAAFKLVQSNSTGKDEKPKAEIQGAGNTGNIIGFQNMISNVDPPTEFSSNLVSSTGSRKSKLTLSNESNLINQKPPPEFDLDSSMISVASLKTEIASIAPLEEGMKDLSIGGDTYTIGGGGSDVTDAEDSFFDETESIGEVRMNSPLFNQKVNQNYQNDDDMHDDRMRMTPVMNDERFRTYTAKKHSTPRQKRKEDPGRYLTRTISPHTPSPRDTNGNHSPSPTYFSTFRVDRAPRIVKPSVSATSNESSPSSSPKGIRGRRKLLYSSLPPQKKSAGPPIPPKPKTSSGNGNIGVIVRATRASELRAASSRDSSPKHSKNSSKNSSTNSLNNSIPPVVAFQRKTPPKPPVRTTTKNQNFAVVRSVRNSNSSIGFTNDKHSPGGDTGFSTLPRSLKSSELSSKEGGTKVGKLSNFWNQLLKTKPDSKMSIENNENNGKETVGNEKKSKFGFHFGRKKKNLTGSWISRLEHQIQVPTSPDPIEFENGISMNYNNEMEREILTTPLVAPSSSSGSSFTSSKMTPV